MFQPIRRRKEALANQAVYLGLAVALVFVWSGAAPLHAADSPKRPPNIVFVLTDDQRWNALVCMGDRIIQTPQMDRLAADGTLFRNCFVTTSICCCSRASILSGQYTRRHGIGDFARPLSAAAWKQTYPALLRQHGYR